MLHSKALKPVHPDITARLLKIQALDVGTFNEAEVRAYVIDPIVDALGYEKGSVFSIDLEKKIDFIQNRKALDYSFNLWSKEFWLIEAKRPANRTAFGYPELSQSPSGKS